MHVIRIERMAGIGPLRPGDFEAAGAAPDASVD